MVASHPTRLCGAPAALSPTCWPQRKQRPVGPRALALGHMGPRALRHVGRACVPGSNPVYQAAPAMENLPALGDAPPAGGRSKCSRGLGETPSAVLSLHEASIGLAAITTFIG